MAGQQTWIMYVFLIAKNPSKLERALMTQISGLILLATRTNIDYTLKGIIKYDNPSLELDKTMYVFIVYISGLICCFLFPFAFSFTIALFLFLLKKKATLSLVSTQIEYI